MSYCLMFSKCIISQYLKIKKKKLYIYQLQNLWCISNNSLVQTLKILD